MANFLTRIFGSRNQRLVRQYSKSVKSINALEAAMQALSDEALKAKTTEFQKRHADGETLLALLPEAFAVAREASVRTMHMRPFDVQLIGGMVLHGSDGGRSVCRARLTRFIGVKSLIRRYQF